MNIPTVPYTAEDSGLFWFNPDKMEDARLPDDLSSIPSSVGILQQIKDSPRIYSDLKLIEFRKLFNS